jgi:RNA ligase (TIGR02306 family)
MRKLATIRRIADIRPIPDADAIEVAVVDGWKVVVKKGEYKPGDLAVYLEIDSWVPHALAPFLSKGQAPREYNGVKGEKLRTIKLRGQVSQGLLLKLETVPEKGISNAVPFIEDGRIRHQVVNGDEGSDVTEILRIQKWEAEIPAQLQGQVRGAFPTSLIPKTDQERIQNCFAEIEAKGDVDYEVTMKLDGTSCTIFRWEGELRVCSRNLELKVNDENRDNTLVKMALAVGDKIANGLAFQGEVWGEGIQGNKEKIKGQRFSVFDIFDINAHEYLSPDRRRQLCYDLDIVHVPVIDSHASAPASVEEGLAIASGPSIHAAHREGVVYKCNENPSFSFKIINNDWLVHYKE